MNIGTFISFVFSLVASFVLAVTLSRGNIPTGVEASILMLLISIVLKQQWEDAQ